MPAIATSTTISYSRARFRSSRWVAHRGRVLDGPSRKMKLQARPTSSILALCLKCAPATAVVADLRQQFDANVLGIPAQYGIQGIPQIPTNGVPAHTSVNFGALSAMGICRGRIRAARQAIFSRFRRTFPSIAASTRFAWAANISTLQHPRLHADNIGRQFHQQWRLHPRSEFNPTVPRISAQFIINPEPTTVTNGLNNVGASNALSASNFPPAFRLACPDMGAYFQDNWRILQKPHVESLRPALGLHRNARRRQRSLCKRGASGAKPA